MSDTDRVSTVRMGTPITTEQAIRAILLRITSPIVGDTTKERPLRTLERVTTEPLASMLSGGERQLVKLAESLAHQNDPIGGLDRDNRRYCLIVLAYLYLGSDARLWDGFSAPEWAAIFDQKPRLEDIG
jgi:ABC-type Mn2+/Zn2+ transport system ATPase subunit